MSTSNGLDGMDGSDSVERFAADLRRLRIDAESPTLTRLQHDSGVSRSVLSDAFAGRALPSARTVAGIARACDADATPWLLRRDALVETTSAVEAEASAAPGRWTRSAGWFRRPTPWTWVLVAGFFLVGTGTGAATALAVTAGMAASKITAPLIHVETGEDPGLTECIADADPVTSATGPDDALIQIMWSDACQAGWARVARYDELEMGNTLSVAIFPQDAPYGALRQEATEPDVNNAYTTLIVRPTPDTLLCATGSFTVAGVSTPISETICT